MMYQRNQMSSNELFAKLVGIKRSENNKIKEEINDSIKIEINKILKVV